MRLLPAVRRTAVGVAAGLVLLGTAGPALAEDARPTVDPSAPSPTAPYEGGPPQGHAPDGSTVGGTGLDTRGLVTVAGAPALPEGINAHGWLVADATTGAVLGAQDPHGRYYPASTLKTLTLLTLAPVLDHDLVVEGTVEDEAIEGSRVGLVRGGQYPVDLLFRALVMQSGNDAANALARAAGGVEKTLAAMNETAERIGAADTVAGTPSGLDVAGQSCSPYDLVLIMRQLVADPYTRDVLETRTAQMPAVPGLTEGYQIQNEDTLLETYPGTLGGKTGFTDAARHTFVVAAERDGRRLVASVMQAERSPVNPKEQAARLLDWGFAIPADSPGVGRLVDPGEVPMGTSPEAAETTDGALSADDAAAVSESAARTRGSDVALAGSSRDPRPPWVPVALAAGAVGIVTATVIGRRRAVRRVPPNGSAAGPPRPPSPSRPPGGPGPA